MRNPRLKPFTSLVLLILLAIPWVSLGVETTTTTSSSPKGQWMVGVAVNTCAKGQLRPCT
jgi:hypothetical protein